jgi:hypothetical protein
MGADTTVSCPRLWRVSCSWSTTRFISPWSSSSAAKDQWYCRLETDEVHKWLFVTIVVLRSVNTRIQMKMEELDGVQTDFRQLPVGTLAALSQLWGPQNYIKNLLNIQNVWDSAQKWPRRESLYTCEGFKWLTEEQLKAGDGLSSLHMVNRHWRWISGIWEPNPLLYSNTYQFGMIVKHWWAHLLRYQSNRQGPDVCLRGTATEVVLSPGSMSQRSREDTPTNFSTKQLLYRMESMTDQRWTSGRIRWDSQLWTSVSCYEHPHGMPSPLYNLIPLVIK